MKCFLFSLMQKSSSCSDVMKAEKPNIIIMNMDDLGKIILKISNLYININLIFFYCNLNLKNIFLFIQCFDPYPDPPNRM